MRRLLHSKAFWAGVRDGYLMAFPYFFGAGLLMLLAIGLWEWLG